MTPMDTKKKSISTIIFLLCCGAIFLFLWNAPPESTHKLPEDDTHKAFQTMGKKEAEKSCENCHHPKGSAPLPAGHPPKYRCLFCHKQKKA